MPLPSDVKSDLTFNRKGPHAILLLRDDTINSRRTSGKCTLSPGHPRTAQDVLKTQRHQRYKVSQVAPRAKSKMLTSLRCPGSFLGHPGPPLDVSLAIFSCLSYFSHFSKFKYIE